MDSLERTRPLCLNSVIKDVLFVLLISADRQDPPVAKKFPISPQHPERLCWGCDRYCAADSLMCGNGSERTQHPAELFGDDWMSFGLDAKEAKEVDEADQGDKVTPSPVQAKAVGR